MIKGGDEAQHVTGGGIVNITAGFVGFGFEGELEVVLVIKRVFTQKVHGFTVALDGIDGAFAGVSFGAFTPTPEYVDLRAEFNAQVDGAHGFLQRVSPHFGVV